MPSFPSDVEYAERGHGPALLFLPGSFSTGAGWKPIIERLGDGYRFVTTSLLGYGATVERRAVGNATTQPQTEVLDVIFKRIAAPVHIVAHSYGGVCALAHAVHGRHKAASLTLIEAGPLGILRTSGEEAQYSRFSEMTEVYFAEFAAGKPDAARHVIDYLGGAGSYEAFPPKVRDYVIATT